MIPKSGNRFSEKIMLKQKAKAKWRLDFKPIRFGTPIVRAGSGKMGTDF
jgi:hypothetical protein